MANDAPDSAPEGAEGPQGVFGNLPASRPGARSPRRRGADDAKNEAKPEVSEAAATEPQESAPAAASARRPEPAAEEEAPLEEPAESSAPEPPSPPQPGIHGIEDLAWAGVAVAAQVATAGIRFTSKALETARKSIDRP